LKGREFPIHLERSLTICILIPADFLICRRRKFRRLVFDSSVQTMAQPLPPAVDWVDVPDRDIRGWRPSLAQ